MTLTQASKQSSDYRAAASSYAASGDTPALVTFQYSHAIAVIMPLSTDVIRSERPDLPVAED